MCESQDLTIQTLSSVMVTLVISRPIWYKSYLQKGERDYEN
jgi:hypothetical protein